MVPATAPGHSPCALFVNVSLIASLSDLFSFIASLKARSLIESSFVIGSSSTVEIKIFAKV